MAKNKYRIVLEFQTSEPIDEALLQDTAGDAFVQLETIEDEHRIRIVESTVHAQADEGTCTCREYVAFSKCDHLA